MRFAQVGHRPEHLGSLTVRISAAQQPMMIEKACRPLAKPKWQYSGDQLYQDDLSKDMLKEFRFLFTVGQKSYSHAGNLFPRLIAACRLC